MAQDDLDWANWRNWASDLDAEINDLREHALRIFQRALVMRNEEAQDRMSQVMTALNHRERARHPAGG